MKSAHAGLTQIDPCGTFSFERGRRVCKNVHERNNDCDLSSDDDSTFVAAFFLAKHNKRRLVTQRDNKASFLPSDHLQVPNPGLLRRHQSVNQSVSRVVGPQLGGNMKVRLKFKSNSDSTANLPK